MDSSGNGSTNLIQGYKQFKIYTMENLYLYGLAFQLQLLTKEEKTELDEILKKAPDEIRDVMDNKGKKSICPACDGDGKILDWVDGYREEVPCGRCNGKGQI